MVLLGFLGGVDVRRRDIPGDAVFDTDFPLFFVDEVVMVAAQEGTVVGGGGPVP